MGGKDGMRADGKNKGMWRGALCALVGASALLGGCATDESASDLHEGTYAVQSIDFASCATNTWLKSSTTTTSLQIEASNEGYVVKACSDGACAATTPGSYAWNVDSWRGQDGGAYLVESGCLLTYVDATASVIGGQLVIETSRWSSQLASGSCVYDEVIAMSEGAPCDTRTKLVAVEQ
jgi:hypothetical protein